MKKRILFLCTGNSARSQIAEALVRARLGDEWEPFSAGVKPSGFVHPLALQVLREIGIDHEGRSKAVDEYRGQPFDLVMTVCDTAAEECPVWLGEGRRSHLDFPDPAKAVGTDDQKLAAFRTVRDEMLEKIIRPLQKWPDVDIKG